MLERLTGGKSFSDSLRYVDDFQTELVEDAQGKVHRKTTYIGTWQVLRDTGRKTLWQLILAAGLAVCAAGLALMLNLLPHAGSGSYLVLIPHLVSLFPGLYLLMGAAALPYRQRPMRRDAYMHSFVRMQRSSVAVIAATAVGAAATLIHRIAAADWVFLAGDGWYLGGCAAVIACCAGILILLGRMEVDERENGFYRDGKTT